MKNSHDQVLAELEVLNDQLKIEQNRNLQLQNDLKSGVSAQRAITEVTPAETGCLFQQILANL